MSTSFGFKAKPGLSKPGKPLSKPSVFGGLADDDDSDDGDPTKSLNKPVQYGLQKPVSSSSSAPSKRSGPGSLNKPSLSKPAPPHEEEEEEEEEEKEDPSIYDYDTAWDSMKAAEDRRKTTTQGSSQDRKPKYMENLLASAKVRERDRLRAKDRMLQKEREAEGEEFADKDKFEEMERKGGGIAGFYRNMLDDTEKHHAELVKATEKKNDEPSFLMSRPGEEQDMKDKVKSEAEIAAELNKKAAGSVDVNDEGQVVDKRQLLGAGLNVKPKPKPTSSKSQGDSRSRDSRDSYSRPMNDDYRANKAKKEMRERQSRMIAQQLEEASRKTARDEAADRAEIERQAKMRKTTTGDVNSARERYLQRKKEAEEKKKAGA
ncbi:hypothetical protein TWF102_007942 [Orbilia oligospora]|uniref:Nuclear speckle splicing regulatory protein 1 N-terminal domain-containing protein n=1 Tax=Orbilia oligospora TaxID=2813651 RepID=A0A7C8N9R6_ORBOL|nr:hypothetical protein TWF102_007942 [Orbilia oligospora]KAF3137734.1 hypothetical protein TWF594_007392 [Orbilia oligospora]